MKIVCCFLLAAGLASVVDPAPLFAASTAAADDNVTRFLILLAVMLFAGKFSGAKTFIEQLEATLPHYYEEVGQHLRAWVPPPPKPKEGAGVLEQTTLTEEASETKSDGGITSETNSDHDEPAETSEVGGTDPSRA